MVPGSETGTPTRNRAAYFYTRRLLCFGLGMIRQTAVKTKPKAVPFKNLLFSDFVTLRENKVYVKWTKQVGWLEVELSKLLSEVLVIKGVDLAAPAAINDFMRVSKNTSDWRSVLRLSVYVLCSETSLAVAAFDALEDFLKNNAKIQQMDSESTFGRRRLTEDRRRSGPRQVPTRSGCATCSEEIRSLKNAISRLKYQYKALQREVRQHHGVSDSDESNNSNDSENVEDDIDHVEDIDRLDGGQREASVDIRSSPRNRAQRQETVPTGQTYNGEDDDEDAKADRKMQSITSISLTHLMF